MTKLPFCLQPSKRSDNNDYAIYKKGEFELEEWEDVNYCEHSFCVDGNYLTDKEIVNLLYIQNKKIERLESRIEYLQKENRGYAVKLGKCGQRISELKKDQ